MNTNTNNTKRNKTNVAPASSALATFHHNSSDWSKLLSSGVRVFITLSTGACKIYYNTHELCCSSKDHGSAWSNQKIWNRYIYRYFLVKFLLNIWLELLADQKGLSSQSWASLGVGRLIRSLLLSTHVLTPVLVLVSAGAWLLEELVLCHFLLGVCVSSSARLDLIIMESRGWDVVSWWDLMVATYSG